MRSRYMITIFLILFLLGISAFFILTGRSGSNEVEAVNTQEKYYTSIEIKEGDTLWSIAGEYMTPEYKDRQEYIKEVKQMNRITGSMIQAGSQLLIPYYSQEAQQTACSQ